MTTAIVQHVHETVCICVFLSSFSPFCPHSPPPLPDRQRRRGGSVAHGFSPVVYHYWCLHQLNWVIGSCNEERSPIPEGHGEEEVGGATYTALSDQKKKKEALVL